MALLSFTTTTTPLTLFSFIKRQPKSCSSLSSTISVSSSRTVRCSSGGAAPSISNEPIVRRSANYEPTNWSYDFVQTLNSDFSRSSFTKRIDELKGHVIRLLDQAENSSDRLELIATLQRLGIAYHFEDKIKTIFTDIYNISYGSGDNSTQISKDFYSTALEFRLLREYGFEVPQDVFNTFKDDEGNFKEIIQKDIKGLLSLYDASFLMEEGESILEEARDFTANLLKKYLEKNEGHEYYSLLATHALELPLHWRMLRVEARWFIDAYQKDENMNPLLLEFAKLDFNNVQAVYQEDLKRVSRWWHSIALGEKLSFVRDRIMESFYWGVGTAFHPELSYFREVTAKNIALISAIDDIYDVYGTLDELEQFTAALERWDASALDELPDYMKICFLTLHNYINEMSFEIHNQQGVLVIPQLKKLWLDLCKGYLVEAKWYYSGYTPTLEEYLENAWVTVGGPLVMMYGYYTTANPIRKEVIDCLKDYPDVVRLGATILRFADDLGTSPEEIKRGDNPKSVQCYMHEAGVSELEAREHIQYLIGEEWKKMNKEQRIAKSKFSSTFVDIQMNIARMAQSIYEFGDGHGNHESRTIDRLLSLIVKNIPCTM